MPQLAHYLGGGNLSVSVGEDQLHAIAESLKGVDADAHQLVSSAISETCKHARTDIGKRMRDHLNLLARNVRDRIDVRQQSTPDNLVGVLSIDYKAIPLADYKARYNPRTGVRVTTVREQGPQRFKWQFIPKSIPHTFQRQKGAPKVAPQKGRYTFAARLARQQAANRVRPHKLAPVVKRQPIDKTFGPSVMRAFELAPGLADAALENASDYLQRRIASKMEWKLGGARGGEPKGD